MYLTRDADDFARHAISKFGAAIIVGRPKSGKTRLAWELLQQRENALVIMPRQPLPASFDASAFWGNEAILFFDDLHRALGNLDPLEWKRKFEEATGQPCPVVCTSRDGEDWKTLRKQRGLLQFLDRFREAVVFVSKVGAQGEDLTREQGLTLARSLGMAGDEFEWRFDGTPGSLALDLTDMLERYELLQDECRGSISMSRLLDSAKLVYEAGRGRLRLPTLRAVAERIRGEASLSNEMWDALVRRTMEEGFGQINRELDEFQIYRPYLEQCVLYDPSQGDFEALVPILVDANEPYSLERLAEILFGRYGSVSVAQQALLAASDQGSQYAQSVLLWFRIFSSDAEESDAAAVLPSGTVWNSIYLAEMMGAMLRFYRNKRAVRNGLKIIQRFAPLQYSDFIVRDILSQLFEKLGDLDPDIDSQIKNIQALQDAEDQGHERGEVSAGKAGLVEWIIGENARAAEHATLEVRYDKSRCLAATLVSPDGLRFHAPTVGAEDWIFKSRAPNVYLVHRCFPPDSDERTVTAFLDSSAPIGVWKVELTTTSAEPVTFRVWKQNR